MLMANLHSPNTVHPRGYVSRGAGDVMCGTMQSFDITAKKSEARPHRYDDCLRAIFVPELDT
jgi:hypothetical protein